jgi:hypothetical protein
MKPVLMRALACEVALLAMALLAAEAQSPQADLTALQIEDLMNVDVTSAWDAQDVPLHLIERIEIIRGPGATQGASPNQQTHQEYFGPDSTELPSLIRRSVYARVTWWF